ncbi:MAG TPA: threonine aldolase family protein [Egicoccus sp.]|nr:threonine aldolase family protein [Egicoccus sp.]HSK21572.1 threonine aldolase family protein [Egicoccus sp.]
MIDLRSDTVTRPTEGVRRAMAAADVGDDVYREDPEVEALQEEVADRFGRDAALFVPSGIMASLVLLRSLVPPGSEVVCESDAHLVAYEAGAAAINAGVQFRTIDGERGRLDVDRVAPRLRPATFPYTALGAISVEETTNRGGGAVHGLDRLRELRALADERGVPLHGDGARLFNAIVATGTDPRDYGAVFTGFSFCLSKGLGAPVGSMVVGDTDTIDAAREWRRRFGGAMRQVGVLAAAGRHVLANHVERLADDHANARRIAEIVADAVPDSCAPDEVETNIVYVATGEVAASEVVDHLRAEQVLVGAMGEHLLRLVTHLDVDADGCARAADLIAKVLTGR